MGSIYGHKIVTDGLVLCLDAANLKSVKYPTKIYDDSVCIVGSGSVGDFSITSGSRVYAADPWENQSIVWASGYGSITYPSQGYIYCNVKSIDNTQMYRCSCWENRVDNNSCTYGNYYFGCNSYGTTDGVYNRSSGSLTNNPYFYSCSYSTSYLVTYDWFLIVGYLWPVGSGTGSNHEDSGMYTIADGRIGNISYDFVCHVDTTTFRPRTLSIYRGNVADMVHHSVHPRMDLCDGNEPTIQELLDNIPDSSCDLSTLNNDSTLMNNPKITDGCMVFNGTTQYVNCGNVSNFGDTFSMSLWVYVTAWDALYSPLIFRDGNTQYNVGLRYDPTGHIEFRQYNGTEIKYGIALSLSTWYNIDVTCSELEGKIYVNGEYKTGGTFGASFDDTGDITIGRYNLSGGYFLNGKISNVKIYNRPLSQTEVIQNHNALKGRFGL